jgi:hypothetical protein
MGDAAPRISFCGPFVTIVSAAILRNAKQRRFTEAESFLLGVRRRWLRVQHLSAIQSPHLISV